MPLPRLVFALTFLLLLGLMSTSAAATLELLRNGGFEQGAGGWSGSGLSSNGCEPRSGAGALAIEADATVAFAQQNVRGPLGDGAYTLTGSLSVASGSPQIEVILTWLDRDGDELARESGSVGGGASYGSFSHRSSRPAGAESLRVRILVDSVDSAVVCLDDLSLEGPPAPQQPTETPTATPSPTPTNTTTPNATATSTSTPKPTATPRPSSTPRPSPTTPLTSSQSFEPVATATATTAVAPEPTDSSRAGSSSAHAESSSAASSNAAKPAPETRDPEPEPTLIRQVRALASADGPRAKQTPRSPTQAAAASDDVPSLWLAGAALFMAGLGGSYALQRRRS